MATRKIQHLTQVELIKTILPNQIHEENKLVFSDGICFFEVQLPISIPGSWL